MDQHPIRVLLVDDDEDYFVLTRDLLSEVEGGCYQLEWRATYSAALAAMEDQPFDVCLLDFNLGSATGLDLLRAALAQGCKAPMVMLTGQGDHELDLEAMQAGAADYLTKEKADAATLERSIRYAMERTRALEALRESKEQMVELYAHEQARRQELEQAYAALRRAEELRDNLTYMIVHDLRNPLTIIVMNLDLVLKLLDEPAQADEPPRLLKNALSASQDMTRLIGDMLDVSKLEAGELHPVLAATHLQPLLADKIKGFRLRADRENKTLILRAPKRLPVVSVDARLIGRVVDNLVENAFKYTERGGHIEVTVETGEQALRVSVRDDGDGIPPEYQRRIFEKFVQVPDLTGAPVRTGTGLGLTFCRLAVEAHQGKIWANSVPGQGSLFTFTLPLGR